jgi:hypothetical protein
VLLVDDDQAEAPQRREDGRAGANDDPHFTTSDAAPLIPALAIAQTAVQHRYPIAKTCSDTVDELMGQRDLGDQHQCGTPGGEAGGDAAQVDLRLAAAGDAPKQEGPKLGEAVLDGADRVALRARELHRPIFRQRVGEHRTVDLFLGDRHQAGVDQRSELRRGVRKCCVQLGLPRPA